MKKLETLIGVGYLHGNKILFNKKDLEPTDVEKQLIKNLTTKQKQDKGVKDNLQKQEISAMQEEQIQKLRNQLEELHGEYVRTEDGLLIAKNMLEKQIEEMMCKLEKAENKKDMAFYIAHLLNTQQKQQPPNELFQQNTDQKKIIEELIEKVNILEQQLHDKETMLNELTVANTKRQEENKDNKKKKKGVIDLDKYSMLEHNDMLNRKVEIKERVEH